MDKLIRFCKGIVRIKVSGYSPERFLNLCKSNEIPLYNVAYSKNGYEMDLLAKDVLLLKKLLRKTGTKFKIKQKSGLPFLLFRYRRHKFFFVGILAAFICLILMSQLVWEIEIKGNYSITDDTFLEYLEKKEITYGAWINQIDCEALEETIRKDYPQIIWVSARMEGTRLIFDVQEMKDNEVNGKPQQVLNKFDENTSNEGNNQDTGTDLVASCDGVIQSIATRRGLPMVTAGMEVKKGDILVSGCNPLYDDYGTILGYDYCDADADVLIETTSVYTDSINRMNSKLTQTGKSHRIFTVLFPKKCLTIGLVNKTYENQQVFMEERPLRIGKRIQFPVQIQEQIIKEVTVTDIQLTEAEIEEIAKKNFSLYGKKMEKKGFQIVDKNGKIKVDEKMVSIMGDVVFQYYETNRVATPIETLELEEGTERKEWH